MYIAHPYSYSFRGHVANNPNYYHFWKNQGGTIKTRIRWVWFLVEKKMKRKKFLYLVFQLPIRFKKKIIIQDEKRIEWEGRLMVDAWFSYHFICPCSFTRNSLFEAVKGTHSQDLWVFGLGQDCTQQGLSFITFCTQSCTGDVITIVMLSAKR